MEQGTASASWALQVLVDQAFQELQRIGYGAQRLRIYRGIWRSFVKFSTAGADPPVFSPTLADSFLRQKGISVNETTRPLRPYQCRIRLAMHKLGEFAQHRCFSCKRRGVRNSILPTVFEDMLAEYLKFSRRHQGLRATTGRVERDHVEKFLHYIDSRRRSISEIKPAILSDFVASLIHLRPTTVARSATSLRSFLRYLCLRGYLPRDLSDQVPVIRGRRYDCLSVAWSPEQTEALLGAVDKTSPLGKRDYAILLLAARLGLRAGDIRGLRLEHLKWNDAQIEIRQSKTGEGLTLPLSEEVGRALIDYLRYARPQSPCREVFLRAHPPFRAFADSNCLHDVITKYRRRAGIRPPPESHHGLHSLRHGLATRLLQVQTPLPTIAGILGHRTPDSTRVYTRVDLTALRTAAL